MRYRTRAKNNLSNFSNNPLKVTFSRANVQGLDDDEEDDYFFALHQYHYIGDPTHNPFGIYDHFGSSHEQLIVNHFHDDFNEHWRLLTVQEFNYLLTGRTTTSGNYFCWAKVASVPGMIVFPDDYQNSYLPTDFPTSYINTQQIEPLTATSSNPLPNTPSIDVYTWYSNFESNGCVFLPCIYMNGTQVTSIQLSSDYWLSDGLSQFQPGSMFSAWGANTTESVLKAYVRLVRELPSSK